MESNKLAPSEIEKIKGFMQTYARIYQHVEELQKRLEDIESTKADLLREIQKVSTDLEVIRVDEEEYQKTLIAKYGEFHLDLETFEYRPA